MKNRIKYLAHYVPLEYKNERSCNKAAWQVMNYLISKLHLIDKDVSVISACGSKNGNKLDAKIVEEDGIKISLLKTVQGKNRITKKLAHLFFRISFLLKMIVNIKKSDLLIVYHSVFLIPFVRIIKEIKKCKLIIQIPEIYGDVMLNKKMSKKEMSFFGIADGYIFQSELLCNTINKSNKPFVVLSGTYLSQPRYKCSFNDNNIHTVYAGSLEERMGVDLAIKAIALLPSNYYLHILGSNELDNINRINSLIMENKCGDRVIFEGLKLGEDYARFLSMCHIGLCPQNQEQRLNNTSFPSKILSYMTCGLRVVSVLIPSISMSCVSSYIWFYSADNPYELAKVIENVNLNDNYNGRAVIDSLDKDFSKALEKLIKKI